MSPMLPNFAKTSFRKREEYISVGRAGHTTGKKSRIWSVIKISGMACRLEIRPLATIEILEAYDWYELQREGLGAEFLDELESFYSTLLQNPNSYGYYDRPVRQGKIDRFPYVVVLSLKVPTTNGQ